MDNKIINAFCRVDWARLRREFEDNVVEIGAKLNCKPFYMFEPTLIYPKYTGSFHISDNGATIVDSGITGRTKEDIDVNIIERSKDYKKLIADTYNEFAHFETYLSDMFEYYKETDREKAIFAKWANRICKQYHDINPPKVATLPKWAQSTEGAQILNKLAEAGYCSHIGQLYKWNKSKALWGVFADEISDAMKLRESNDNVPYVMIAEAFVDIDDSFITRATEAVSRRKNGWIKRTKGDEKLIELIYK